MVKISTVLVSTVSNSQVILLKKCIKVAFHIFSAKILAYMPYLMTEVLASVAQLDEPSDWRPAGRGFNPR